MKFSVIIPIYNVEKYLRECVDSVLAQDFRDYEIILVDDGSTDNSGKICDEYSEKYPQIKTIHKENAGPSDARNFGIKEAKGDYLMFLDSDDYWEGTNVFSDLSEIIQRDNNPDLIFSGTTRRDGIKRIPHIADFSIIKDDKDFVANFEHLVATNIYSCSTCTKIVKRNILIENNLFFEKDVLYEDVIYCFDLAFYIKTYSLYKSNFYQYRAREGSITTKPKNIQDLMKVINNKLHYLIKNDKEISSLELKLGLKAFILVPLYHFFREYIRFSILDTLIFYKEHKQIWEKSCKIWGKDFMRKRYFNNRRIGYLPFSIALLIASIEQKIYKY